MIVINTPIQPNLEQQIGNSVKYGLQPVYAFLQLLFGLHRRLIGPPSAADVHILSCS